MPELPEVETIRRQLSPKLLGRTITAAWAFDSPKFDEASLAVGTTITSLRRRGKYLLVELSSPETAASELVIHLGMTGRLTVTPPTTGDEPGTTAVEAADRHLRARWSFEDGSTLRFHDVRRFGRVAVVRSGHYEQLPTLASLGPEPDDEAFDAEHLRSAVNGGRRHVKTVLLSQRTVAGVGNIYADEALWRSGVDPRARRLTRVAALRLRDAVREVIAQGIASGGTTLRDYRDADGNRGTNQDQLDCYGRQGEPCHRCGTTIVHAVVDARSTSWCPHCQRR
ncbi:MAG: bifunctional DNA-formamidopyrimidine glycosylase/DNA-(apurinic or apyrimidinic site) lyase [Actinobacteria bacterium]|nr:bifunctional DNA-formamidopyrimidine glycosylase/DNA-(apurinic or apyrimidinic site) lyase [Actinomycetota bacterium]